MLGFLKETFQSLNQRIGKELSNVTCSVETFVSKKSPKCELFEYYKKILQQHSFVLKVIESGRVLRDEEDSMGFSMNAIWQAIQTE
eukprot:Awhi_evm1s5289